MTVLNINNYNFSSLNISSPSKIKTGYNMKIQYNNSDFEVQTPLCVITDINVKGKKPFIEVSFSISKNFRHFQFHCGLIQQITENIEKHAQNSKYNILDNVTGQDEDTIENAFESSIDRIDDSDISLFIKLTKETMFFDKDKTEISGLELNVGDKIVGLVYNKGVFIDKTNANFRWTASQIIKVKTKST